MTVSSTLRRAGPFAGNNATTAFPFAFKVFDKTDIKLLRIDSTGATQELTLDSDYSVTLNANQDTAPGGTIAYPISGSPLPSGYSLVVLGDLAYLQETDLTNQGGFYPQSVEDMVDRATIQIQQLAEIASHGVQTPPGDSGTVTLPSAAGRAGMVVGFDANGNVTMLPMPASVGAGDLRIEEWANGTDYVAGTSTSVTLSRAYGNKANLGSVVMQGIPQDPSTYSIVGNSTLQFNAPIPVGVNNIWCTGGTTLSVYKPPDESVGDSTLQWGASLARNVDTIAAMRSLNHFINLRASTNGSNARGDGGGGDYVIDPTDSTSTDNGGTTIVTTSGGRFKYNWNGVLSAKLFGAVGDGVTDDTDALQRWLNVLQLLGRKGYLPAGRYRKTRRLSVLIGSCEIFGDGWQDMRDITGPTTRKWTQAVVRGTIIYDDYTAAADPYGIYVNANSFKIRDIEFEQNQGDPDSLTWAAVAGPTAIYCYTAPYYNNGGSSVDIRNIMLRNVYQGIILQGVARGVIDGVFGQPRRAGISVTQNGDVLRIRNIHFGWPFWSSSNLVYADQLANGFAIQLGRVDNPNLDSIFSFHMKATVMCYEDTTPTFGGRVSHGLMTNFGSDDGVYGLYCVDSAMLDVVNGYVYTRSGVGSIPVYAVNTLGAGHGCELKLTNFDIQGADTNAIYIANGGTVDIANLKLRTWNGNNGSFAGIRTAALLRHVNIDVTNAAANGAPVFQVDTGGGISGYYDPAGNVSFAKQVFTGTCDGSGNATFGHSIANLPALVLNCEGFYKSATDGAALPMTFNFASSTSVSFHGGAAGQSYRVTVTYSPLPIGVW